MIKSLIDEIAYDKITLTQALTRAKVLAFKIENITFQEWLKKELEGYETDVNLPTYRRINCVPVATVGDRIGRTQTIPVNFKDWKEAEQLLSNTNISMGIPALEENYLLLKSENCTMDLPKEIVQDMREPFQRVNPGLRLITVGQELNKLQLKNIIELTKQKLIDTLLQLNKEFPDLDDDFKTDRTKSDKIQNIVTNNIYGSNNPVNVAAGHNVDQKDFTFNSSINYSELEKLGVQKQEIEELKTIVDDHKNDKSGLKSKVLKWFGTVAASIASKGLSDQIPAVMEHIHHLIN
ncbi:MAG: hypothetical protein JST50_02395 [Bacteroidetes bacterium]|jgi:hypothetical protein|nr:hypothetical protein [Bacteroidota bacterium]